MPAVQADNYAVEFKEGAEGQTFDPVMPEVVTTIIEDEPIDCYTLPPWLTDFVDLGRTLVIDQIAYEVVDSLEICETELEVQTATASQELCYLSTTVLMSHLGRKVTSFSVDNKTYSIVKTRFEASIAQWNGTHIQIEA